MLTTGADQPLRCKKIKGEFSTKEMERFHRSKSMLRYNPNKRIMMINLSLTCAMSVHTNFS